MCRGQQVNTFVLIEQLKSDRKKAAVLELWNKERDLARKSAVRPYLLSIGSAIPQTHTPPTPCPRLFPVSALCSADRCWNHRVRPSVDAAAPTA